MTQPPTTTVCAANPEQSQFVGVFAVSGFIMCSTADEATFLLERLDPDRAGGGGGLDWNFWLCEWQVSAAKRDSSSFTDCRLRVNAKHMFECISHFFAFSYHTAYGTSARF